MNEKQVALNPGGSALIRGVMMSNGVRVAAAARTPEGEIVSKVFVDESTVRPPRVNVPERVRKMPVLRGVFGVGGGLGYSLDAMRWSAVVQNSEAKVLESYTMKKVMSSMFVVFAGVFGMLPIVVAFKVAARFDGSSMAFALGEALFSVGIFLGYLGIIGRLPHIREVFEYHGAEHKTVAAYEAGMPLTPEIVAGYSRFHPRCGTNYMALVLLGTTLMAPMMMAFPLWLSLPLRMVGLVLVAGLAYEVLKSASLHLDGWGRFVLAPGLAIQRLTTREPALDQLEVAIHAFTLALSEEQRSELSNRPALVAA